MKKFLLLLSVLLFAVMISRGTNWYVGTAGSNSNTGTSSGAPFLTIQFAINTAASGDVITVGAGTYYEEVSITGKTNLTLAGAGEGLTIIAPYRAYTSANYGITVDNSNGTIIRNLTIDGFANAGLTAGVAHFKDGIHENAGGNNCIFTHITVKNIDRRAISIFPETVSNNEVSYCTITNVLGTSFAQSQGIQFSGTGKVEHNTISFVAGGVYGTCNSAGTISIQDNVISDLNGATYTPFNIGINIWCQLGNDITVKNNSITCNVAVNNGIYVVRGGDGSEISYNTINLTGNGGAGIETGWENTWGFPIHHNTITMGKGGAGIIVTGAGTDADPMLIYNNTLTNVGSDDSFVNDYTDYPIREVGLLLSGHAYTSRTGDARYSFRGSIYNNSISGFKDGIVIVSEPFAAGSKNAQIMYNDKNSISNYEKAARYGYITPAPANPPVSAVCTLNEIDPSNVNFVQQDLSMNYWGTTAPDFNNVIDGKINYCKYYTNALLTTLGPIRNERTALVYCTIQAAVAAAMAGDVINVAAGTYTESGQIVIDKNLSIVGADKATTIIKTNQATGSSGDAGGWFLVNAGATFSISNLTFDGTGYDVRQGIRSWGPITVENCAFRNIAYSGYLGWGVVFFANGTVNNCQFTNIGRIGINSAGNNSTTASITNNTYTGKGSGDFLDYGVVVNYGATATITGNTISALRGIASSDGSTSAAMMITTAYGAGTVATITGNTISDCSYGITVGRNATNGAPTVSATNNSLTNIEFNAVESYGTPLPQVTATCNWWGTTVPSEVEYHTNGNVSFLPFLVSNNLVAPDCSGNGPVVNTTRSTSYMTIQAAIAAAMAGDVINVAAGTYAEVGQIVIDKNLTIVGANKATTIIKTNQNTGSSGNSRGWFLVNGGVTFDLSGVTLDGTDHDVYFGILSLGTSSINIDNNIFKNILFPDYMGRGVYMVGNGTVSNCQFTKIGRIGVHCAGNNTTTATVSNNTYTGKGAGDWLDYAIVVNTGATATVSGNTISNIYGTASSDGSTSCAVMITCNFGAGTQATISDNTIHHCSYGVEVWGHATNGNPDVTLVNNSITEIDQLAVESTFGATFPQVTATNNYWGGTGPQGGIYTLNTGSKLSANVSFIPWWCDALMTTACPPLDPGMAIMNTETGIQYPPEALNTALTAAANGQTLFVATVVHGTVCNLGSKTVYIVGSGVPGQSVLSGASPALSVTGGNVEVTGITYTMAGTLNDPTILVSGGTLKLRNCIINETSGFDQACLRVTGGSVDAGTLADAGNNQFLVHLDGSAIDNQQHVTLPAYYNYWGSASGPTVVSNPNGKGGAIVETVADDVKYNPWYSCPGGSGIDIGIFATTCSDFEVRMRPTVDYTSTSLTDILFTIKYPKALTLGSITYPSGSEIPVNSLSFVSTSTDGAYKYTVFAGEDIDVPSWTAGTEVTLLRFSHDQAGSGNGNFVIADDAWTSTHNGTFYASILGPDKTGSIYAEADGVDLGKCPLLIDGSYAANDKVYDGNATATFETYALTLSGVKTGDVVTLLQPNVTLAFSAGKDAGNNKNVTITAVTLSGADAGRYSLPAEPSPDVPADITPKPLTATVIDNPNRYYNGNTNATLTTANYQLATMVGSEAITVTKTTGSYALKDVGTQLVTVALNPLTDFTPVGSAILANYTLPTTASGNGTINALPITITPTAGQAKVFGAANPPTYAYTYSPALISPDVMSGELGRVGGEAVAAYAYTLNSLDAGSNYTLSMAASPATFAITAVTMNLTVILQGPYNATTGLMNTSINGNIPLTQPFNTSPWYYSGTESVVSVPANAVDWVLVELRSTSNGNAVGRFAALLNSDGTVNITVNSLTYPSITFGSSYYIVVWHRNHLPVMSATARVMPLAGCDFRVLTNCYLDGAVEPDHALRPGVYAMIAGDVTQNGSLKYSGPNNDRGPIIQRIVTETGSSNINGKTAAGYWQEDVNLSKDVKYTGSENDRAIIISNLIKLTGSNLINSTYTTVVPLAYTGGKSASTGSGMVDIQLTESTKNLRIVLSTRDNIYNGIVDNIQFTLAWFAADISMAKMIETYASAFNLLPQGDAVELNGIKYRTFASVTPASLPLTWTPDENVSVLSFDKENSETIGNRLWIASNDHTSATNGDFYISTFGSDVTGSVIGTITATDKDSEVNSVQIYPNPVTSGRLFLQITSTVSENLTVEIWDMNGRMVKTAPVQSTNGTVSLKMDVTGFAPGVYLVHLSGGKTTFGSRFIVR